MTTAYTPILKLALPVTGELNGTWGDVVNNNITSMVEQAVAGLATINTWTANSHTLTSADGTTSESRCAMLVIDDDGAGNPSAAATVICPAASKAYIVRNICGQTVTLRTSAGTGIDVLNNQSALLFCDGTNVYTGSFNGDVVGPASATDNAIARFDGTTGKLIQNSAVTIGDDGATVIDVNSTSAGLRITQTGAGNALLVEDSANPDATPTVIDANGRIVVGDSTARSTSSVTGKIQVVTTSVFDGGLAQYMYSADANPQINTFNKSRSATVGVQTVVQSGDNLGDFRFAGSDGTNFIEAAKITAAVDGTPGTNDMPGRLMFLTTADGASSPTERMRIGNSGTVGIGTSNIAAATVSIGKTLTGATTTYGVLQSGQVQSDVTTVNYGFLGQLNTQATAFTLANQRHFAATQGTIGAGSSVTTQAGFFAASSLTGATNNYGFYGDIASGTGRWNFYAAGTAVNYFAGNVGIATTSPAVGLSVATTDAVKLPVGTTAQRPTGATGYVRYNSDTAGFEGYNGTSWGSLGGGNSTTYGLWENNATISANYTISSGNNALSAGPITVASGVVVTVPSGSTWTIV